MLNGCMFIEGSPVRGNADSFHALNPATGEALSPTFYTAGEDDIAHACEAASRAVVELRDVSAARRAELLLTIAEELAADEHVIVSRAALETGLSVDRLASELARTQMQLALFAKVVDTGTFLDVRINRTNPLQQPSAAIDIRQMRVPVGPVAVFGASNFPLAFSVAGGDTASALAAGCPVVVKGHPSHPGTAELVAKAIVRAIERLALPPGMFSLLVGQGHQLGTSLVRHPAIQAVGFTGSRQGGMALTKAATYRPVPIPVFAEMSSINPVLLLPAALHQRANSIAKDFVSSLTKGAGQYCTCPGLLLAIVGEGLTRFEIDVADALVDTPALTMLSDGIHATYEEGVESLRSSEVTNCLAMGQSGGRCTGVSHVFTTNAVDFMRNPQLHDEVFGASALLVRCHSSQQLLDVAASLEGQLTATIQADAADEALAKAAINLLQPKVGRVLYNDFPTGVEVCDAMVHGGPFPATSDGRTTSVGSAAIDRFLRRVCFQNLPDHLLPPELQQSNPLLIPQRVDGF